MQPVNEQELVERCRRGDEGAFQELVNRYKDPVSYTHLTLPTIYSV